MTGLTRMTMEVEINMNTDTTEMQQMALMCGGSLVLGLACGVIVTVAYMRSVTVPEARLMTLRSLLWALQSRVRTAMTSGSIRVVNDSLGAALNLIEQAGMMTGGTLNDEGDR
mgnify:CR=1 FL=1